ncbi:MAG: hypothetical protein ABEK12_02775 [Candidatus Nanohaloarchaea archaeon]
MTREEIRRLSLLSAIIGLGVMYVATGLGGPTRVDPGEIDGTLLGETVTVTGRIGDISRSEDGVFFTVSGQSGDIRAVNFDDANVTADARYRLVGRVDLYHGDLELVVERAEQVTAN